MTHPQCLYTPLDSSLLAAAAYSAHQTLELEFRSGAVYRYFAVPPIVFRSLLAATSKGAYFNRNVRNNSTYQRVA